MEQELNVSGSGETEVNYDNPFSIFSQNWFPFVAAFLGLFLLVVTAVIIIIIIKSRICIKRRSFRITDNSKHNSQELQEVVGLQVISNFSNGSDFEILPVSSSFITGTGGSTSSSNPSESHHSSTSTALFPQISRPSIPSQLTTQEDSAYINRNSIVMDSSELRPLSTGPPPRRRSRKNDYDHLEKIPESLAEKGKLFVFLPKESSPEDDSVFENSSAPSSNSTQLPSEVTVNADTANSLAIKQGSLTMYEDASSIPYPENAHNSSIEMHTTEAVTECDHYSIPFEALPEVTSISVWSSPVKARPQSSIYTNIDDIDVELLSGHPTSPPEPEAAEVFTLSPLLVDTGTPRPGSSIYTSIDSIPNSVLPERTPLAENRQSAIYTSIDETLLPQPISTEERQPHSEYSYASSLMLKSPEKVGSVEPNDGEFCLVPDDHHKYTYIMDKNPKTKKVEVKKRQQMHALVYQNVPVILSQDCEQLLQQQTVQLSRSMSTPDILLSSGTYDEKSAPVDSPQKFLKSPQSGALSCSSNSHSDLVSLQLQEELEQYSAYYNAAKIAGVGGWIVKEDKPLPEEQANNPSDDYHSDLSLWLTPEQRFFRSWSLGRSQDYACQQQLLQNSPRKQTTAEGNYTKIFAREVQRHVYEKPCFMSLQSKTLQRPTHYSHKPPKSSSYVNQLVWISNKPVYPRFHKPHGSDSCYTHLLPPTELDDDGYTMPTV